MHQHILGESSHAESSFQVVWGGHGSVSTSIHCGLWCLTTLGCESFTTNEQSAEQCQLHNKQALTELATYNLSNLWVKHSQLPLIFSNSKFMQKSETDKSQEILKLTNYDTFCHFGCSHYIPLYGRQKD